MALPTKFRWDARTGRYRDARGRFVPAVRIRREIDRTIAAAERRIQGLARQLQRREITVAEWELAMRREMKRMHLSHAAAAKGGWAQMAPADYGRVGQLVRAQYKFLNNFAQQVSKGLTLDGRFLRRVELYAQAGRTTYEQTNRVVMVRSGYTEERSVRHSGDSCPGCIDEEAKGWVPIGELQPIGQRDCLSRCRCTLEYR